MLILFSDYKSGHILSPVSLLLVFVVTVAFTLVPPPSFTVEIQGIDNNVLKEGVTPQELGRLTITSNNEEISVEEFSVSIAKGARPVSLRTVKGDSFDLSVFSGQVSSGDRILIQIEQTSAGKIERTVPHVNLFIILIR